MISVDGACRGNGKPGARAAIGTDFVTESGSPYVEAHVLLGRIPTNQRAEIRAGIMALEAIGDLVTSGSVPKDMEDLAGLNLIAVKTDSAYLVNAATVWTFKWRMNGYINKKGQPVVNQDRFKRLEGLIQSFVEKQILVKFLHVRGEFNRRADDLANRALDD